MNEEPVQLPPAQPLNVQPPVHKRKVVLFVIVISVALVLLGFFVYHSRQQSNQTKASATTSKDSQTIKSPQSTTTPTVTPEEKIQAETRITLSEVGKLITLPQDETPTIARVVNADSARQQSPNFYKDAQSGDVVVLYTKAAEAILYRPSTNKIIIVMPLPLR